MDIRFFCYRCFVFLGLWVGYEAQNGNQTTHQRTDDVEEAQAVHGTSTLVTVALSSVLRLKSSGR